MAKLIKPESFINADTKFYTLPLENGGFELTVNNLNAHYYPLPKSRKDFEGVWAILVDYKNELNIVRVDMPGEEMHYLYLHIIPGEMEVCCNCGMWGGLLCKHAYYGLRNLMFNRDHYSFDSYYWPGYTKEVNGSNKFLHISPGKISYPIQPQRSYGNLFRPGLGFQKEDTIRIEKQAERQLQPEQKGNQLVVGYCLVYTYSHMVSYLPVLVPYLGITDKSVQKIQQFKAFITEDTVPADINFTDSQLFLNKLCFELLRMAKAVDSINESDDEQHLVLKDRQLALWHKVLDAGIATQEFIHSYYTFGFKALKNKPVKSLMKACYLAASFPDLSFLLRDKGDHFSLHAVITNRDQEIQLTSNKVKLFVANENGAVYYSLATVQDDDLLNWLSDYKNCLTVLKVHFTEFHEQFLKKLSECYPVYVQMKKSGQKVLYDFEVLAGRLI